MSLFLSSHKLLSPKQSFEGLENIKNSSTKQLSPGKLCQHNINIMF